MGCCMLVAKIRWLYLFVVCTITTLVIAWVAQYVILIEHCCCISLAVDRTITIPDCIYNQQVVCWYAYKSCAIHHLVHPSPIHRVLTLDWHSVTWAHQLDTLHAAYHTNVCRIVSWNKVIKEVHSHKWFAITPLDLTRSNDLDRLVTQYSILSMYPYYTRGVVVHTKSGRSFVWMMHSCP